MAGYSGYSKSNNANAAERDGRFPMTQAKRVVSANTNVSQATAEQILRALHRGEYHHTSKRYNCTNYYDTVAASWVIGLANRLNLDPTDALFLATCIAHGLNQDEDDRAGLDEAQFTADYEAGTWKYMIG
jgi:hypothetical protein